MSTKSQSFIVPFLVIAGLLLAAAAGWKFMGGDETKPSNKPVITDTPTAKPSTGVPSSIKKADPKPVQQPVVEETPTLFEPMVEPKTHEEKEAAREVARSHMKFAMRYNTPDKALEALKGAVELGDEQQALDLISFIEKTFPNTSIPSELLDF